jgi:hypothetical protein
MHRNTEVSIEDGPESRNEVGNYATMNGLECHITSRQSCRIEVDNHAALKLAIMLQ